MVHTIEFHGRLSRADGRPANPGTYDLDFRLHDTADAITALWREEARDVAVAAGGFYHVILGFGTPLHPRLFASGPKFLSCSIARGARSGEEMGERVALLGATLRLEATVADLDARLAALEIERQAVPALDGALIRRRLVSLRRRQRRLEGGGGVIGVLLTRLAALEQRVQRIDGDDGRLDRLEDELEDLVGPDGDVVDLDERMVAIERHRPDPYRIVDAGISLLEERIDRLERTARGDGPRDGRPPPRARPKP